MQAEIKKVYPEMNIMIKVCELNESQLKYEITQELRQEIYKKMIIYKYFLVTVKSEHGKKFAFFVPCKFEETANEAIKTGKQIAFFWINYFTMITCNDNSISPEFLSNAKYLIELTWGAIKIKNTGDDFDQALLDSQFWKGMKQGIDKSPKKNLDGDYLIAGGDDHLFKATHIEFYGFTE